MRIGSLFSGYGGLDMAATEFFAGELAWVSDIDKAACAILAKHHPQVPNLGDITRIDWSTVEPVDGLCGGSPCQDLSIAGRRAGIADGTRSGPWSSMRDAITAIKPATVIWENVRGALSAPAASDMESDPGLLGNPSGRPPLRALGRVLGDLATLGYDAQWTGIRASDVGAPHHRFRIFLLATDTSHQRRGLPRPHQPPDPTPGQALREPGGHVHKPLKALLPTPKATNNENRQSDGYLNLGTVLGLVPGIEGRIASTGPGEPWGKFTPAIRRWEHALGRPAPAPTIVGQRGRDRLSPAFVEWMMGLPDGWVTRVGGLSRLQMLRALGNGVVPQQATAALHILTTTMMKDIA